MSKTIIAVKPGSLKAKDKEKLSKSGFLVVEHDQPAAGIVFHKQEDPSPSLRVSHDYVYVLCAACAERIYMPKEKHKNLLDRKGTSFYCFHGHSNSY